MTMETGIGMGIVANGKVIHGLVHLEGDHIRLRVVVSIIVTVLKNWPHAPQLQKGVRTGTDIKDLDKISDIWTCMADYLVQAILNLILIISPDRVVMGGGLMNRKILMPMIHSRFKELLNEYAQHPVLRQPEKYIVYSQYTNSGILAAILLTTQTND